MALNATQQMLKGEVKELVTILGVEPDEAVPVLSDLSAELMASKPAPQFNADELVTGHTMPESKTLVSAMDRTGLAQVFLHFFPRGNPSMIQQDGDLRAFILSAVNYRKAELGIP